MMMMMTTLITCRRNNDKNTAANYQRAESARANANPIGPT